MSYLESTTAGSVLPPPPVKMSKKRAAEPPRFPPPHMQPDTQLPQLQQQQHQLEQFQEQPLTMQQEPQPTQLPSLPAEATKSNDANSGYTDLRPNLDFDAFIREEESTKANSKMQKIQKKIYDCTKNGTYNCLALLMGIPFLLIWGIALGLISFCMNYMYTPFLRIFEWILNATLPVMGPLMNCCSPIVEMCASVIRKK